MGEDTIIQAIQRVVADIESNPVINSEGLRNTMYPDHLIVAMHNHLGNVYQIVTSSKEAMNGTEQFMAMQHAQKELDEMSSNLFKAKMTGLISPTQYESLAAKIRDVSAEIKGSVDTEYH